MTPSETGASANGAITTTWVQQQMQLSPDGAPPVEPGDPKLSHCSGSIISQANTSAPVTSNRSRAISRNRAARVIHLEASMLLVTKREEAYILKLDQRGNSAWRSGLTPLGPVSFNCQSI